MADRIINRIASDKSIGLVFPDDPNVIGWGENLALCNEPCKPTWNRGFTTESDL